MSELCYLFFQNQDFIYADNDTVHQILNMDMLFHERGYFEKTLPPKSGSASRVIPVYKPGDVIKGHVTLALREPLEAKNFRIVATGKASVYTIVSDAYGEEKYMDESIMLWTRAKCGANLSEKLIPNSDVLPPSDRIPPGDYEFPFAFQIPPIALASCPPLYDVDGRQCHIVYRLVAVINRNKLFKRGNILAMQGLWVEQEVDIADNADDLVPLVVEKSYKPGVFRKSGHLNCIARLPSRAFVKGETIELDLEIANHTPLDIDEVRARVVIEGKARTGYGTFDETVRFKNRSEKEKCGMIAINTTETCKLSLDLKNTGIDNNLLPFSRNLQNCKLIDLKYTIEIKFKRKGLHRKLDMKIPIVLGSHNTALSHTIKTDA